MYSKELSERNPLRLFEHSIHGGLGPGDGGVELALASVGGDDQRGTGLPVEAEGGVVSEEGSVRGHPPEEAAPVGIGEERIRAQEQVH